jgi:hypothetical protein
MNEEKFEKLEYNTKIEWFINVFSDDLELGFKDSPEFDEAFEIFVDRMYKQITKDKKKILIQEVV